MLRDPRLSGESWRLVRGMSGAICIHASLHPSPDPSQRDRVCSYRQPHVSVATELLSDYRSPCRLLHVCPSLFHANGCHGGVQRHINVRLCPVRARSPLSWTALPPRAIASGWRVLTGSTSQVTILSR